MDGGTYVGKDLGMCPLWWAFPTITAFGKEFISDGPDQSLIWALKLPANLC